MAHPDYPHNIVVRVGDGQSPSGKILDRGTHWYNLSSYQEAIDYAMNTHRKIYVSFSNRKYREYSIEKFENLIETKLENQ